jgi:hypothetical protein
VKIKTMPAKPDLTLSGHESHFEIVVRARMLAGATHLRQLWPEIRAAIRAEKTQRVSGLMSVLSQYFEVR